ncbi:hypothetical protein HMPREF9946_02384 [Acetobacteraceae bacterium AT-5844]|nr:hypothetical protein HMPREF9946_02384 [Acetobacteraceae bacterium AT-5844]
MVIGSSVAESPTLHPSQPPMSSASRIDEHYRSDSGATSG